jgi:hypothetical protein
MVDVVKIVLWHDLDQDLVTTDHKGTNEYLDAAVKIQSQLMGYSILDYVCY